jgi:ABC-type lipoprotein release transport system permease subunit
MLPPNEYFNDYDSGFAVIGDGLSQFLNLNIGDTIILIGQGYHGASAAGQFVVKGIVRLPAPDIDNSIVYLPIASARELYAAEGITTSAVLRLKNNDEKNVIRTADNLRKICPDPDSQNWKELNAIMSTIGCRQ